MKPIELKRTQLPKLTRRSFLAGSGVCMSLPLLEAMLPSGKTAFAADANPTRLLTMFTGNGIHMQTFQLNESQAFSNGFGTATTLNPLLPLIDDVTTIKGLFNDPMKGMTGDHGKGSAAFLTCAAAKKNTISTNISMDVVAANQIAHQTPIPLIHMGLDRSYGGFPDNGFPGEYLSNISWQDPTTPVPKEYSPLQLFNRLFGDGSPNNAMKIYTGNNLNKSIIDLVLEDANRLQRKLGVADKEQIQGYLDSVRELERALQFSQVSCENPTGDAFNDDRNFITNSRQMNDLMVLAFTCDLTRIISYMFSNGLTGRRYYNLGLERGHHDLADHGGQASNMEKLRKIDTYHMEELADLCMKLKAQTDVQGQSLLDSCIVYYSSEIADGNSHSHYDLPILLVGKGNGTIRPGRHINIGIERAELANLYLTMMNAVGAKVDSFASSTGRLNLA